MNQNPQCKTWTFDHILLYRSKSPRSGMKLWSASPPRDHVFIFKFPTPAQRCPPHKAQDSDTCNTKRNNGETYNTMETNDPHQCLESLLKEIVQVAVLNEFMDCIMYKCETLTMFHIRYMMNCWLNGSICLHGAFKEVTCLNNSMCKFHIYEIVPDGCMF